MAKGGDGQFPPNAEGVGFCLYTVTATDLLTQNKRYMPWLQQHDSHKTLREGSLYNYVLKTLLILEFFNSTV
jgi:hypothetical protein